VANEAVVVIDVQNAILDIPGMKRPAETGAPFDTLKAVKGGGQEGPTHMSRSSFDFNDLTPYNPPQHR